MSDTRSQPASKLKVAGTIDGWTRMGSMNLTQRDMNRLVLRFMADQGYDDAVTKFITEAGSEPGMDLGTWNVFLEVQKDLQSGNVSDAVEKLNNLHPELLNTDIELLCKLLQQGFIELIRTGKDAEALAYSQERLAPIVQENPTRYREFAEIISLLAYKDNPDSPAAKFLDTLWRSKAANEVKEAIFRSQVNEKDWHVARKIKELKMVQEYLDVLALYPRVQNLSSGVVDFSPMCILYPKTENDYSPGRFFW